MLKLYTIYLNAADLLPGYAVREWSAEPGQGGVPVGGPVLAQGLRSLELAREVVPRSADHLVPRAADDEPIIVETWV